MNELLAKIQGRKTYLLAITGALGSLIALLNGQIDTAEFARQLIDCALAATIRHGIASQGVESK